MRGGGGLSIGTIFLEPIGEVPRVLGVLGTWGLWGAFADREPELLPAQHSVNSMQDGLRLGIL